MGFFRAAVPNYRAVRAYLDADPVGNAGTGRGRSTGALRLAVLPAGSRCC
jgi:hypothetical protein